MKYKDSGEFVVPAGTTEPIEVKFDTPLAGVPGTISSTEGESDELAPVVTNVSETGFFLKIAVPQSTDTLVYWWAEVPTNAQ